mmetsp:Transcript_53500/g.122961  ORF Transcript_53500/g.122961 Transcript_53500/m.122961 type:complete len:353 (-) Transcript_53500:319-1377(-)
MKIREEPKQPQSMMMSTHGEVARRQLGCASSVSDPTYPHPGCAPRPCPRTTYPTYFTYTALPRVSAAVMSMPARRHAEMPARRHAEMPACRHGSCRDAHVCPLAAMLRCPLARCYAHAHECAGREEWRTERFGAFAFALAALCRARSRSQPLSLSRSHTGLPSLSRSALHAEAVALCRRCGASPRLRPLLVSLPARSLAFILLEEVLVALLARALVVKRAGGVLRKVFDTGAPKVAAIDPLGAAILFGSLEAVAEPRVVPFRGADAALAFPVTLAFGIVALLFPPLAVVLALTRQRAADSSGRALCKPDTRGFVAVLAVVLPVLACDALIDSVDFVILASVLAWAPWAGVHP